MAEERLAEGDRVVVYGYGDVPLRLRTVTRSLRRFVELSDGTRWRPDGRDHYPRSMVFLNHDYIARANPKRLREFRKAAMCARLKSTKWSELSFQTLERICRLLPQSEKSG